VTVRIINADVMDGLAQLPDESVHCVVTSPPYWGLRDYGMQGQLGLEPTLGEHIEAMVKVFRAVRRVLRNDGTLWLNYGDCYASSVNGRKAADIVDDDRTFRDKPFSTVGPIYDPAGGAKGGGYRGCTKQREESALPAGRICAGGVLKPKDLCGVPWRIAFALQDNGWWLRQDIIWSKPNPMPESIKDRCTKAHEYLFLLAKSERYYFDAEAIAEAVSGDPEAPRNAWDAKDYLIPGQKPQKRTSRSGNKERKAASERGVPVDTNGSTNGAVAGSIPWEGSTRNKRSVWEVATAPFSEAHFATFPPALIEPCIKAGCPIGGTVLDPFLGSGTTGMVADRLGRSCIGIELNPEYAAMAEQRIKGDCPMFAEVSA
jgi:DNA modification methylase